MRGPCKQQLKILALDGAKAFPNRKSCDVVTWVCGERVVIAGSGRYKSAVLRQLRVRFYLTQGASRRGSDSTVSHSVDQYRELSTNKVSVEHQHTHKQHLDRTHGQFTIPPVRPGPIPLPNGTHIRPTGDSVWPRNMWWRKRDKREDHRKLQ